MAPAPENGAPGAPNYYANVNPQLLAQVPLTARHVLELGCGAGSFARAYRARNPAACYRGVELFDEAARQAAQWLDSVTVGDIESAEVLSRLDEVRQGQPFDTLVFGDVLEHLRDPWGLLAALAGRCTPGAVCVVCVPNVSHWSLVMQQLQGRWDYVDAGLLDRTHLRFFTLATGQEMLRGAGWQTTESLSRQLWPEKTAAAVKALASAAQALGIPLERMAQNVSAFQWVIRGVRGTPPPSLHVAALGLRRAAGVTDVRVDQPMAALATLPGVRTVCGAPQLSIPKDWPPGVLILQRNFLTDATLVNLVERRIAGGWVVVAEMDDDPHRWPEFVNADFRAFWAVHGVTVSTAPLAEMMRQWNPLVGVFENAIHELPEVAPQTPKQGDRLRVFFGALNREGDWGEVQEGILGAARALGDRVEWVVVHDRAFHDALPPECRKSFQPTLPHGDYVRVLGTCDLALLPLADTPFNRMKSDLKFIECCSAGVVPICSEVVYGRREVHRGIGVFATTAQDWREALLQLVDKPDEIRQRRALGLDYVRRERMLGQQIPAREQFYRDLLNNQADLEAQRQARLGAMAGKDRGP